ncbi:NYN domain limkain-b1-type [Arabidopsis suecica]|uniref:NYN domain limkain-b1-type n=1 Tax=Arabidopsis suecica TaxID=45249 RepID=A0A8T2C8D1_ARASU|nr:NYN domain limkain-b1-type [Arabidopsis suecica]
MKKATQEQAKALTLVFWDIIKCPVPDGCDPRVVRPSIKRLLENNGYCGPLTVTAIGKLADVPIDILRALYSSGIHLTIAPFGSSDIRGLIDMAETANFMVISNDKACSGLLLTLKAIGYNPLMPFPYGSLDLLIMEDSLVLEEETGDSALWDCLVCLHDPPAHGFENFITHLSSGEHKVLLMMPRNTVPRPPIDLSRVHVNHYLTERDLMRRNQLWTDERPTPLSTSVYQLKDLEAVKSKGETFVYWDIKLCPVPPYCDASLVGPCIKRFLKEEGFSGPLTIIAIGVLTDVPIDILQKVYSSGIALHIAPNGPSDIRSLIFDRVHMNGPLRNIMVISNDEYFANHFDLLHSTAFCNFKLFDSLPMEGSGECSKTGVSPFWFCSLCNFRNFPYQDIDSFTNHLSGTYHQRKLSDLLSMRSGHCLGAPLREPLKENLEAVTSVYWDIKMCPVPPGCDPRRVGPCIKRFLDNKGYSGPLIITAMGALEDVPNDILRGVHSSGIALNCIPYGFSISLERHIYEFMDWNPPPANVMVISDAKHSASNDVFGIQSKGYNFVEPVPCDSLESFFLAGDSGALEDDKCGETSLLGYLYCWVCCRDLDNFENFTTHLTGRRHQRKLECKKSVDMKKAQGVLV